MLRFLAEDFSDHDRIIVYPVHDSPSGAGVIDPELMATWANARHWSGFWHVKKLPHLEQSEKVARFHPRLGREWGSLDFAM